MYKHTEKYDYLEKKYIKDSQELRGHEMSQIYYNADLVIRFANYFPAEKKSWHGHKFEKKY